MPKRGGAKGGGNGLILREGVDEPVGFDDNLGGVRGERLPLSDEGEAISGISWKLTVLRWMRCGLVLRFASPAGCIAVATALHVYEIHGAGTGGSGVIPTLAQRIPAPRSGLFAEKLHCVTDGDTAKFVALWRLRVRRCVSFDAAPEELRIVVVAVADVARDIKVLSAYVRRSVEKVHGVAAADDRTN